MSANLMAVPGLHGWNAPHEIVYTKAASLRLWAVPATGLIALGFLAILNANQSLFLALNKLCAALPPELWASMTSLGDTLPAFALLLPLVLRRPDAAAAALIAVVLASLGSQALKHGLDMPRPPNVLAPDQFQLTGPRLGGRSFPSGHTTAAFTVAALIAGYTLQRGRMLLVMLGAWLVGLSRIAVGAHWPADVMGGMTLGWLAGYAGLHLAAYCRFCMARAVHIFTIALFATGTLWLLTGFDSGYDDARWLERLVALSSLSLLVVFLFGKLRQLLAPSSP